MSSFLRVWKFGAGEQRGRVAGCGAVGRLVLLAVLLGSGACAGGAAPAQRNPAENAPRAASMAALLREMPPLPEPVPATPLRGATQGTIRFDSSSPGDFDVLLADPQRNPASGLGTLFLPERAAAWNQVPAVVLLHGSGGIAPGREPEYAHQLASMGIAALVVDYYGARGTGPEYPYMQRVLAVTEFDVVADAYGALRALSKHPSIDADRIVVAGFSYGGMAARIAMDERVRQRLAPGSPGFAAFVDVYGPCFQNFGTKAVNGAPLLTLRGTEDASNDLAACARREDELRQLGVDVEAHVFPGAGHAWEVDIPRERKSAPYVRDCEVVYDASGRASVDGKPYGHLPLSASRLERTASRARGQQVLQSCARHDGYIVGRDDATRAKADVAFYGFLNRVLYPAPIPEPEPAPDESAESAPDSASDDSASDAGAAVPPPAQGAEG